MNNEEQKTCCEKTESVCVFLVSGMTYSFRGVFGVVDNENCISFSYRAMSDGRTKTIVFYKYNGTVAGVSRY